MSKLLNSSQTGNTSEHLKEMREDIIKKWEATGLLDGITGQTKSNIAQLMCCEASALLTEEGYTGKTDLEVYEKGQLKK